MLHSLYGVENPLMDVIAHVDYPFLKRFGKNPGTMHLVEYAEITRLLSEISSFRTSPGGSAANTARGIAWLSGEAGQGLRDEVLGPQQERPPAPRAPVFNGAIGRDSRGDEFAARMADAGVDAALVRKDTPTGTSVILVTPDGERTMNTFLGACRDFTVDDLDLDRLADSRMLYLTGYLWDTENQRQAADRAARSARADGRALTIAFDLADPFAVRRYAQKLVAWIPERVDVLFGNRDELALLTGSSCDEDCLGQAMRLAPVVVMKTGDQGCLVGWDGKCEHVPGVRVKVVDTTGAGDAFAAGFLYGRLLGASPLECARLANAVAARIVSVEGCTYEDLQ
jgi:sugar/nucleoside kinase (ribokinase family)